MPPTTASQRRRNRSLDDRRSQNPGDDIGSAGDREQEQAEPETMTYDAEGGDRRAPASDRENYV